MRSISPRRGLPCRGFFQSLGSQGFAKRIYMPALNFQAMFADDVQAERKTTSIRGRAMKLNDTVFLFTGMRTKACRRLGYGTVIGCRPIHLGWKQDGTPLIRIDGKAINAFERELLAQRDGFASDRSMLEWFEYTYNKNDKSSKLAFDGFLIHWRMSGDPDRLLMTAAKLHNIAAQLTANLLRKVPEVPPIVKKAAKTPAPRQSTGAWNQASTTLARIPKA
jgi:hypothetical protein